MTSAKDMAADVEGRATRKSRRGIGRRGLLKAALIGVPAVVAGGGGAAGVLWAKADVSTVGQVRFRHRLAVPPLAPSRVDGDGRRVFQLRAAAGRTAFRGRATPTWGYNGGYLGPTLRAARGETVSVNVTNALPETTPCLVSQAKWARSAEPSRRGAPPRMASQVFASPAVRHLLRDQFVVDLAHARRCLL